MNGRPTAEIVADWFENELTYDAFKNKTNDELAASLLASLPLPDCPTCGGTREVFPPEDREHAPGDVIMGVRGHSCPDCVDGKVSIGRLVAVFNAVWSDEMTYTTGKWSRADVLAHLRSVR